MSVRGEVVSVVVSRCVNSRQYGEARVLLRCHIIVFRKAIVSFQARLVIFLGFLCASYNVLRV